MTQPSLYKLENTEYEKTDFNLLRNTVTHPKIESQSTLPIGQATL